MSFETEFKYLLEYLKIKFTDYTDSHHYPDFLLDVRRGQQFALELKEKRQRINTKSWPKTNTPEEYLFIIDELTVRKLLVYAPYSGVLIQDNVSGAYIFFNIIQLVLIPRVKVNRPLNDQRTVLKGKWMIDLRNGWSIKPIEIGRVLDAYLAQLTGQVVTTPECYGYYGEVIPQGGEVRTSQFKEMDHR